jgi:hypothetical protein
MALLTQDDINKLLHNGLSENRDQDHAPVVKLFHPGSNCFWLLSEIDPQQPDAAFGLCDLGMGRPELGYVSISELEAVEFCIGWKIERDNQFVPEFPMSVYALAARWKGWITDDRFALIHASETLKAENKVRHSPGLRPF